MKISHGTVGLRLEEFMKKLQQLEVAILIELWDTLLEIF